MINKLHELGLQTLLLNNLIIVTFYVLFTWKMVKTVSQQPSKSWTFKVHFPCVKWIWFINWNGYEWLQETQGQFSEKQPYFGFAQFNESSLGILLYSNIFVTGYEEVDDEELVRAVRSVPGAIVSPTKNYTREYIRLVISKHMISFTIIHLYMP